TIDASDTGTPAGTGATSSVEGPLSAGSYSFTAHFSGDSNYNVANSPVEPLVVNTPSKTSPTITTSPGGTIVRGSGAALTDSADLEGGSSPTGTITFTLYAPGGGVVYTDTVMVSGNGTYTTSQGDHPGGYVPTGTA